MEHLVKTGAYCKSCIKIISVKRSNANKFTFQKLQDYCKENNIQLLEDYTNIHITKKRLIKAKCQYDNCNESVKKEFRQIEKSWSLLLKMFQKFGILMKIMLNTDITLIYLYHHKINV